jgi:EmrB/QacA subfamily drug resistance transporter
VLLWACEDACPVAAGAGTTFDGKRRVTLAIVITGAVITSLDNTVLNVAIPSILREFHAELSAVQWVVSGYALTFATMLIIGGRLGDVYGHRRAFVAGGLLFAAGSLLASLATSVPTLVIGEAVVEGIGAALMLPATTAILSTTFTGRERGTAFAAWGAAVGAAAAFGPAVGGVLTTYASWRWALRVNVIVAPAAVTGALLILPRDPPRSERAHVDVPGALLIGAGMFSLVFALSQGATYGWWHPSRPFTIGGARAWPADASLSVIPVAFALAAVLLVAFCVLQRWKEQRGTHPLFELSSLGNRGYRYGLLTSVVMATAQLGLIFVLPIVLQDAEHLSAVRTGLWLVPFGLVILAGAQLGGRLTNRLDAPAVVRIGLILEAIGLVALALVLSPHVTLPALLPGMSLFGVGYGFASAQLVNVILADVPKDRTGVAGAANTTVRQVGAALGVAVVGALLSAQTVHHARAAIAHSDLPASVQADARARLDAEGVTFQPSPGTDPADATILRRAVDTAIADAARPPLLFTAGGAAAAALVALLLPSTRSRRGAGAGVEPVEPGASPPDG